MEITVFRARSETGGDHMIIDRGFQSLSGAAANGMAEREEAILSCKALFHRDIFNALNIRTIEIYLDRPTCTSCAAFARHTLASLREGSAHPSLPRTLCPAPAKAIRATSAMISDSNRRRR